MNNNIDFYSLPPEIQYQILLQDPELIYKSQQINHYYRALMSQPYFKEFCTRPITLDEIIKYISTYDNFGYVDSYINTTGTVILSHQNNIYIVFII